MKKVNAAEVREIFRLMEDARKYCYFDINQALEGLRIRLTTIERTSMDCLVKFHHLTPAATGVPSIPPGRS